MSSDGASTTTLSLACYRVTFEAMEPLALPEYLGSTLRGAFGDAFRKLCCPAPREEACPISAACAYHLVLETAPPPDSRALRTHEEIPRPFVIAPSPAAADEYRRGDHVVFDLTLIGRAREFLPHFVVTLREVEHIGLAVDFRALIEQARAVRLVRDETRWTTWSRYSSRQDRRMEWAGPVGTATYEGDLTPFWPYLVFGQWTHVGKGATFGLGGYRLEPPGRSRE
jgi:hypothetical protein